jgi:2,4-dienoyl-CoA reductase-like NADH-dependent reductase (Old Yellow Enzyme family)
MLGVHSDKCIPGLREVADAIHEGGAKASIQPMHGGRQAPRWVTGTQPLAPSSAHPWNEPARPVTTKEAEELIYNFAEACARAKYCGFDTVLIHAAHGFLLTEFMSPWTNVGRTDRFADPTVFICEVIRKTKEMCGKDFPVMVRINVDEFVGPEGITPELNKRLIPAMVEAGADGFDLTNSNFDTLEYNLEPIYWSRGGRVDQLLQVRELTTVPLCVRGRINDPILVEKIIEEGRADMVGLGRAMLCDPDFAKKMQEGRYDDIRKCIACDWACAWKLFEQVPIKCAINYNYGKEYLEWWGPPPAKVSRKVLVVGVVREGWSAPGFWRKEDTR